MFAHIVSVTFEPGMLHVAAHVEDEVRVDLDNDLLTKVDWKVLFVVFLSDLDTAIVRT